MVISTAQMPRHHAVQGHLQKYRMLDGVLWASFQEDFRGACFRCPLPSRLIYHSLWVSRSSRWNNLRSITRESAAITTSAANWA